MPDGIDAAMDPMQRPSLKPSSYRAPSNSVSKQLMAADHSVLRIRQLREQPIDVAFCLACMTSFTFGPCQGLNVKLIQIAASR